MSGALIHLLDGAAHACRTADIPPTSDECEQMLRSLHTVSFEVAGLADRLRESMVNNTPVPHPVKPYTPPPPKPQPAPKPPPPPPPPPRPSR